MADENTAQSEVLFSKIIPKMNKSGDRQVGNLKVETKVFDGYKFIQLTQHKEGFGMPGSSNYQPPKDSWVTFDPKNKDIKEALLEAVKS